MTTQRCRRSHRKGAAPVEFIRWLLAVFAISISTAVHAQVTIVVNDTRDLPDFDLLDGLIDADQPAAGNQITLRAAVENANLLGGWIIIQLAGTTYTLDHWGTDDVSKFGDLDVYSGLLTQLTIQGVVNTTSIDASGLWALGPDRVLHITTGVSNSAIVELKDLRLTNGRGVSFGAGIRHAAGKLHLTNVSIDNCWANDQGGALHTDVVSPGETYLINCTIGPDNRAAFDGGGIYYVTANAVANSISFSQITGNTAGNKGGGIRVASLANLGTSGVSVDHNSAADGGGISNHNGVIFSGAGSITDNQATGTGGGVNNDGGATFQTNPATVISGNSAGIGGGINNAGSAVLIATTVRNNTAATGGGINNVGTNLRLRFTTISSNIATGAIGGGGIHGFGRLTAVNSTISGNQANAGRGGGIYFDGGIFTADLSDVTVAFNSAGGPGAGIYTDSGLGVTAFTIIGTLIANNTVPPAFLPWNFAGGIPLTSLGFNLDTDGTCALSAIGDQSSIAALIGPLQNNGGITDTHALLSGSPAINHGSCVDYLGAAITTDQRNSPRIPPCDVGAYEAPAGAPPGNDACAAAFMVVAPGVIGFSNLNATTDGPPGACGFTGAPGQDSDVWYFYQAPCHGFVSITLDAVPSGSFNALLEAYPTCPPAPSLGCAGGFPGPVSVTLQTQAGATYVIRAGGQNGAQGNLSLSFTQNCDCPADIFPQSGGNNVVDIDDLVLVITHWNPCPSGCPPYCTGDVNHDCTVNIDDIVQVITHWGPCP